MKRATLKADNTLPLVPIQVDVDLVRFEKNLLQIGFFGANDARDKGRTSRRIEQTVFRNGHKVRVAAEFRGSEQLGLPSTTDRDKFIALLKIVNEDRARIGTIQNPIRFSGYRMIQELGLSRNGEIYEEILRWGKRMTDTTITSEQVVYFAAKKVYSDEVLHVFRSFRRTGSSKLSGAERQEHYEVVLEDWILENLNQRYVVPEDFNAYKQLTRPTAKGIFGNLHLWFHASAGRPVEKDYAELCNLLNIQTYPHLSKIKSTMGLALNELIAVHYLSRWDVQPMSSKEGYKIVMAPGKALLDILQNQRGERRLQAPEAPSQLIPAQLTPSQPSPGQPSPAQPAPNSATPRSTARHTPSNPAATIDTDHPIALELLRRHGVLTTRATQLLDRFGASAVIDTVDYLETQMSATRRSAVANPAGLIVYSLENGLPIPDGFLTRAKRRELDLLTQQDRSRSEARFEAETAYGQWTEARRTEALAARFSPAELDEKLKQIVLEHSRQDAAFRRVPMPHRMRLAERLLLRELVDSIPLPTFEEWLKQNAQTTLFR